MNRQSVESGLVFATQLENFLERESDSQEGDLLDIKEFLQTHQVEEYDRFITILRIFDRWRENLNREPCEIPL